MAGKILNKIDNVIDFSKNPDLLEEELSELIEDKNSIGLLEEKASISQKRVMKLIEESSKDFINREEAVKTILAGLVSGISVVLFGPPGTAKSALIRRITSLSGLNSSEEKYFEYLLTNHTMPEEIFGSVNLEELSKGRIKRETRGKLPKAEIAFLDELFRGGSHILNTLLTIINEKRFDSGDGMEQVPLLGLIGASNDVPRDPDLEAFYDRFPIRVWLESVLDTNIKSLDSFEKNTYELLDSSLQNEKRRIFSSWNPKVSIEKEKQGIISCTNDFRLIRAYIISNIRNASKERKDQYINMFKDVKYRCRLSDRSFGFLWLYAAALDFINGRDITCKSPESQGHIDVFKYVPRSRKDCSFLEDIVKKRKNNDNYTSNI